MVLWEEQLLQELHFNSHFLSLPCCSWVLLSPSCDVAGLAFLHACAEAAKWFFPCDELIITYSTFVNAWSLQITPEWKNKSLIGGLSLSTVRCGFLNVCLSDIAVITILWAWADQVELHLVGGGETKTKSSVVFFFKRKQNSAVAFGFWSRCYGWILCLLWSYRNYIKVLLCSTRELIEKPIALIIQLLMFQRLHLINFFDYWNYKQASQTEVEHASRHLSSDKRFPVYTYAEIPNSWSYFWILKINSNASFRQEIREQRRLSLAYVLGTCSSLREICFKSVYFQKNFLPFLALQDRANLACCSCAWCSAAMTAASLSMECEVLSFQILIFFVEASCRGFAVEQTLQRVAGLSMWVRCHHHPSLENAQYVSWYPKFEKPWDVCFPMGMN